MSYFGDWVVRNQLLSGLGAAIITVGGEAIRRILSRKRRTALVASTLPVSAVPAVAPVGSIQLTLTAPEVNPGPASNLANVVEQLARLPPYKRWEVARHYEGITVYADGVLGSAEPETAGGTYVFVRTKNCGNITFSVRALDYLALAIMPVGHPIHVEGFIQEITSISTQLKDVTLTYPPVGQN